MKNRILLVLLLLCSISYGQQSLNSFDWNKVSYGGRINLDLSNALTSVIVAPTAMYEINNQFSAGASVSFGYTKGRGSNIELYNYGVSVLGSYKPIQKLEVSAELEQNFLNWSGASFIENTNYMSLYLGAGYRVKKILVGMRYDVLYKEDTSLYASAFAPFVRVYF